MNKYVNLIIIVLLLQAGSAFAQPSPGPTPEGFVNGQVVLADNSTVSGAIKENIRKRGEITVLVGTNKKKYTAGDVQSVQVGATNYIIQSYTFYELVWEGKNISLFRKANQPSGVHYNGTEAVTNSSEGNVDDLLVKAGDGSLQLLTKKNIKDVLGKICSSCAASVGSDFNADSIKKAVSDCDACK